MFIKRKSIVHCPCTTIWFI